MKKLGNSMQNVVRTATKLSSFHVKTFRQFCSQKNLVEEVVKKTSNIFMGSKPKKQFSEKDLIKDDTLEMLTTYAKAINKEGTILKIKNVQSHKESNDLNNFPF